MIKTRRWCGRGEVAGFKVTFEVAGASVRSNWEEVEVHRSCGKRHKMWPGTDGGDG